MIVASDASTRPNSGASPDVWAEADLVRRVCLGLEIAARAITVIGPDVFRDEDEP